MTDKILANIVHIENIKLDFVNNLITADLLLASDTPGKFFMMKGAITVSSAPFNEIRNELVNKLLEHIKSNDLIKIDQIDRSDVNTLERQVANG